MPAMKPFEEYLHLLLDLYKLTDQDGGEADLIRDQMDKPWFKLNEQEREVIRLVAEILYNNDIPNILYRR